MKKYLFLALFFLFSLFYTRTVYGTVAPIYPTYYQKVCSMIMDTHIVDGYKLVLVSGFSGDIKEIEPYTCLKGYVFLVPEDLDVSFIKTIKWSFDGHENFPGHFNEIWNFSSKFFGESFIWALENEDTKLVGKLVDKYSFYKDKPKFSHLLELNKFELGNDGEYWLNSYYSLGYDYKYIYYILGGIILFFGIRFLIIRKNHSISKVE